jgi:hypothetical protein
VGGEKWAETKNAAVPKILCEVNALVFWHSIVNQDLQTINTVYYTDFQQWLVKRMNWVRPPPVHNESWFLLHNSAMSCNTVTVKQICLTGRVLCFIIHPTCLTSPRWIFSLPQTQICPESSVFLTHNRNSSCSDKGTEQNSERGLPRTD